MTLITRSALVYWGHNPAPNVASVVIEHRGPGGRRVVTWDDVMAMRRERQAKRLEVIRRVTRVHAWKLWVAYFDQSLMGGWQAMLENHRGRYHGDIWIDRDRQWLRPKLMEAFPMGLLPFGSEREQWERWKPEFAKAFERRRHDKRPLGVHYLWWNQRDSPIPVTLR